jgi:hypothetical protein
LQHGSFLAAIMKGGLSETRLAGVILSSMVNARISLGSAAAW